MHVIAKRDRRNNLSDSSTVLNERSIFARPEDRFMGGRRQGHDSRLVELTAIGS